MFVFVATNTTAGRIVSDWLEMKRVQCAQNFQFRIFLIRVGMRGHSKKLQRVLKSHLASPLIVWSKREVMVFIKQALPSLLEGAWGGPSRPATPPVPLRSGAASLALTPVGAVARHVPAYPCNEKRYCEALSVPSLAPASAGDTPKRRKNVAAAAPAKRSQEQTPRRRCLSSERNPACWNALGAAPAVRRHRPCRCGLGPLSVSPAVCYFEIRRNVKMPA